MGRGSWGATGLAPLGRAGYAHARDANTGGRPIQTNVTALPLRHKTLASSQLSGQFHELLERQRLGADGRDQLIPATALMASIGRLGRILRREGNSPDVFRRWANAAFTTRHKARLLFGDSNASCLRDATRRRRSPTSGRGRKQLADTLNAFFMSAAYCIITDKHRNPASPAFATRRSATSFCSISTRRGKRWRCSRNLKRSGVEM